MKNKKPKEFSEAPSFADDDFWNEFNDALRELARNGEIVEPSGKNAADDLSLADQRKNDCLSFSRCDELAKSRAGLTRTEETHLESCRYCQRHINAFASLPEPSVQPQASPVTIDPPRTAGLMARFKEFLGTNLDFSSRRFAFGLAAAGLLVGAGTFGFLVLRNINRSADLARDAQVESGPKETATPAPNVPTPTPNIETGRTPDGAEPNDRNREERTAIPEDPKSDEPRNQADLRGIPSDEQRIIELALGDANIPLSDDLRRLRGRHNTLDADAGTTVTMLLGPSGEALIEPRPEFAWNGSDATYRVSVFDRRMKEVLKSEDLTARRWRADRELPPGQYFWEVTTVKENGELAKTRQAAFEVVERSKVDEVRASNDSNLVKAIYFARRGLLDEAKKELRAELKKNPGSQKAARLMRRIQNLRKP